MKNSVKTYDEFFELANNHFNSFNCERLSASRQSLLAFIPHLSQFTQIEISSVFVYLSSSRKTSWCRIYFATPLLTCSARFSCESVFMTPSVLLGFLSNLSPTHSFETSFYCV